VIALRRHPVLWFGLCAGGFALAGAAIALVSSTQRAVLWLTLAQTFGVVWLGALGYRSRNWGSASFITAAAWVLLFLAPCWIYVARPDMLQAAKSAVPAISLLDLSVFAMVGGGLVYRWRATTPMPPGRLSVESSVAPSRRALAGFALLGLLCLGVLMAKNGGPVAYISNQYNSGSVNSGLLYFIWGVLFLRYAPLAAVATRWANGLKAGWLLLAYLMLGSVVVAVMGARAFLASAAVDVVLVAHLIRRPLRLRWIALPAVVVTLVVVFGLGAIKNYTAYNAAHRGHKLGLATYLTGVAPSQAFNDYVYNYADGVNVIALTRRVVPARADYEYGRSLLDLLLRPIPSAYRPKVWQAPVIRNSLNPGGGYTLAVPLQASVYLEFGVPGVLVVFLGLGALLAALDRRLATRECVSLPYALTVIALAVQIPVLLRAGIPGGVVLLLLDVAGVWISTRFVTGRAPLAGRVAGWIQRAKHLRRIATRDDVGGEGVTDHTSGAHDRVLADAHSLEHD